MQWNTNQQLKMKELLIQATNMNRLLYTEVLKLGCETELPEKLVKI